MWADFRGGIIVGKAVNTRFENVMVMESTLHVTCANNALNLITNAGFEGGLIVGELDGCTSTTARSVAAVPSTIRPRACRRSAVRVCIWRRLPATLRTRLSSTAA